MEKQNEKKKEDLDKLFSPIIKNEDFKKARISPNRKEKLFTLGFGLLHGFILMNIQILALLGFIDNSFGSIAIWMFIVSFPLGLLVEDFFQGLYISMISYVCWFFFTVVFLSTPAILGVVVAGDIFIIKQITYVVVYTLFTLGPVIFGISLGAIVLEFL